VLNERIGEGEKEIRKEVHPQESRRSLAEPKKKTFYQQKSGAGYSFEEGMHVPKVKIVLNYAVGAEALVRMNAKKARTPF